jgi:RimJ/RimL family protein N-acetyltransferase
VEHDIVLTGHGVRLVPVAPAHAAELFALIDAPLWAGMTTSPPATVDVVERSIAGACQAPGRYAFAVLDDDTGQVRGQTSFYDVAPEQERCEIGHTFYGRPWWGGRTNPACKLLLLAHAFEAWGMHRVALRADARNLRSIGAITRLGAVPEGVLRGHRVAADGTRGDTAYFSILRAEWPAVRAGLEARLAA